MKGALKILRYNQDTLTSSFLEIQLWLQKFKKKMLISAVVDIDNKSFYFLGETFSSELNFKLLG
jgi:hypothetical protein